MTSACLLRQCRHSSDHIIHPNKDETCSQLNRLEIYTASCLGTLHCWTQLPQLPAWACAIACSSPCNLESSEPSRIHFTVSYIRHHAAARLSCALLCAGQRSCRQLCRLCHGLRSDLGPHTQQRHRRLYHCAHKSKHVASGLVFLCWRPWRDSNHHPLTGKEPYVAHVLYSHAT